VPAALLNVHDFQIVPLVSLMVRDDIAEHRLVPVLQEFNPGDLEELHAVYLGQGGLLPLRIRVFLAFSAERIKVSYLEPALAAAPVHCRGRIAEIKGSSWRLDRLMIIPQMPLGECPARA
jgi:hypothetical protein